MSFSSELKDELGGVIDSARHCRIAELAAILCFCGRFEKQADGTWRIHVSVENPNPIRAFQILLKQVFHMDAIIQERKSPRNLVSYAIDYSGPETEEAAEALKLMQKGEKTVPDLGRLTEKNCCKRAALRGAYLSAGSVSDPDRFYHFELSCRDADTAAQFLQIMSGLHLDAKMVERQKYFVIYVKESEQISNVLGLMGARKSLLELENARIRREVRGAINRRVNCETANINKAARAAARQIEDIRYIEENMGLSSLPNGLDEMARIRLQYPEANLSELGSYLEPPVGKSGVNHRLRKINKIAASLRNQGGEEE